MKKTYLADGPDDDADDVTTKDGLLAHLGKMKDGLKESISKDLDVTAKAAAETLVTEKMEAITTMETRLKAMEDSATSVEVIKKLEEDMATTIKAFDLLQTRMKGQPVGTQNKIKSLGEVFKEKMEEHGVVWDETGKASSGGEIEKALKSQGGSYVIKLGPVNLKAQGADMTLANSLTGDSVATYNQRQSLIPGQNVNFRDLMPTVMSPTGLYVTYSEDTGETNNITNQTEGSTKGQNEYDFTELKTVAKYQSGFAVFSKQLLKFLPFMEGTLTRALLRDFYKSENAYFFSTVSGAATGSTSGGTSPDDIKQLVNVIAAQKDANFKVDYVLVSNAVMCRLIISTYTTGYYAGAGAVAVGMGGVITIWGVPIIAASWVTANYALLIDSDYLERVEVEGLNIAFSFEDASNFRQNKVTARIECFEEVNFMRPASGSYMNLGAS